MAQIKWLYNSFIKFKNYPIHTKIFKPTGQVVFYYPALHSVELPLQILQNLSSKLIAQDIVIYEINFLITGGFSCLKTIDTSLDL